MKKLICIFFISLSVFELYAQTVKPYYREDEKQTKERSVKKNKNFLAALKRKVLVVLEEEDPQRIKELQKSEGKLAEYRRLINHNNQLLKKLIPQFWRQDSTTIVFKKYSECLALKKSGSKDYFAIEFSSIKNKENFDPALMEKDPLIKRKELLSKAGEFGKFEISLIEKFGKSSFYDFATITSIPNELDFTISIQMINNFFLSKYFEPTLSKGGYESSVMEKHATLQSKTLLIDSAQVNFSGGFNMKDLKENYPYNFKLAGITEILKEVKTQNGAYAYLLVYPNLSVSGKDNSFNNTTGGGMSDVVKDQIATYTHYIIDCAGSEPLFLAKNQPRLLEKTSWQLNITHILKLYNFNIVR
jgi:hypothetical protein